MGVLPLTDWHLCFMSLLGEIHQLKGTFCGFFGECVVPPVLV